jgi:hypothetical protein
MLYFKNALRNTFLFGWMAVPRNLLLAQLRFPACAGMTKVIVILSKAKDLLLAFDFNHDFN